MKKVSLLILVSMILLLAFTSCDLLPAGLKDTIDGILGKHEHVWMDATCESPKTCECGETEGEALGHNWSDATCETAKTCTVCGKTDGEALGHTWADATCDTPKTCSVCKKTEGAALGHKWTAASCDAAKACSVCGKTDGSALGHSFTNYVSNNDATCTADATKTAKCDRCDETDTITVEGSALGHAYKYECDAFCMNCNELTNENPTHKIAFVEAKDPTCTAEGNIAYYTCEYCGSCWLDAELKRLTNRPSTVIDMIPHVYFNACDKICEACNQMTNPDATHTISHVEAKAATCTENGNNEYWTCSDCGYCWSDAELKFNTNIKNVIIPAPGHQYTYECDAHCNVCHELTNENAAHSIKFVEAVAPTCYVDGNNAYYTCEWCGSCWLDAELTDVTNVKNVVAPAEHKTLVHMDAKAPGCHYIGNVEYWMCYDCETVWTDAELKMLSNTKSVILAALGGDVVHVEAKLDCYEGGNIEHWYCEKCEQVWQDEALTQLTNFKNVQLAPGHLDVKHFDAVAPACHYNGNDEYWMCYACETVWTDEALTHISNVKNVIVPATGEGRLAHIDAVAPGCHFEGNVEYWICYDCEQVWTDEALTQLSNTKNVILPELGGNVIHVEALAPNCTEMGNIEFWYCEECMQVWQDEARTQLTNMKSVKLPANGHTFSNPTCQTLATCACGATTGELACHNVEYDVFAQSYYCTYDGCDETFVVDNLLAYDGENTDFLFTKNGDATCTVNENGEYVIKAGESRSQYMFYGPSNDMNHKNTFKGWNSDNNALGVVAFKVQPGTITEDFRFIIMSGRNNPNWDANGGWNGNSVDILQIHPNGDGTFNVNGNNVTSNVFATVKGDEWVDVKMFLKIDANGLFNISYYINGEFFNVYAIDFLDTTVHQSIRNLDINNFYFCGYTAPGTGFVIDDIYFGYSENTEWKFDTHKHVWVDATCTTAKHCSACGEVDGEALGHSALPAVKENVVAPNCTEAGSHDEVVYCGTCGEELSRTPVVDDALGHTNETVPGYAATCTEFGLTDGTKCSVCGVTTLAQTSIDPLGHKDENADEICDVCNADLACKHPTTEPVKGTAATCTSTGLSDAEKCTVCGEIIGQTVIDALGHKPADAVAEEVVLPTCTADGSHYDAVYCSVCNELLSRTKVTDSALGHNEVPHAGQAATCTEKGWKDYVTCSRCDYTTYTEIAATGHTWSGAATCVSGKTCSACGTSDPTLNPNGHYIQATYEGGKLFYTCQRCDYRFDVDTFAYHDGSNASIPGSNYTGTGAQYNNGTNKYASNGEYVYAITDINATGAEASQMQLWVPGIKNGDGSFKGFSLDNESVGALSLKVKLSLTNASDALSLKLVESGWGAAGCIDINVLAFTPVFDSTKTNFQGKINVYGYSNVAGDGSTTLITTLDVDAENWTEWVDIKMMLTMNTETGNLDVLYYINGEFVHAGTKKITTTGKSICSVYANLNAWNAGTGVMFDDIAFGYTAHTHNLVPNQANGVITLDCACGASYIVENYLEWNGDGNDSGYKNVPNGNVPLTVNGNGEYEYIFKPATDTAPDFSADGTQSADGWYEYDKSGCAGGQLQMWMPSNNRGEGTFADFSCENNATGVISFKMKSSLSRHPDKDTSLTFSVGKPRNASDWNDGGSWTDDSINIFTIRSYQESGVVLKGGKNGNDVTLATIPVADGWSEWFTVTISIEMRDNGDMNLYYYINGVYCGSYSRNLNQAGEDGRYLNPKKIEALQISGWTYVPNTGIIFDDFVFGYTVGGHNSLNGQSHKLTEGANCSEKSTCSCGWTGYTVAHNYVSDCATTCTGCGLVRSNAGTHASLTTVIADNSVKYVCGDCGMYYAPDNHSVYLDCDTKLTTFSYNNEIAIKAEDGYNRVYMTESDGTYHNSSLGNQHMLWIPSGSTPPEFDGFTCANNATGLLSFKIKGYSDTNNIECKINDARGTSAFDWSKTSVSIFCIAPVKDPNATTTDILGLNGQKIGTVPVGADHWTEWLDVAIIIHLSSDNTISVDYYLNGKYFANIHVAMPINTYKISTFYINGYVKDQNGGYCLDDMAFGYTTGGMHQYKAPIYSSVINAEDVASETLKTIVASKFKQCDQCTTVNAQGGTPVYVLADKDGAQVEALYVSRTYAWTGSEAEDFTEFRFAINGESKEGPMVTGISFDYKIDGTVAKNEEHQFTGLQGEKFYADAYVQIKTAANHPLAGDNYPELSGSDLTLDGEWHTFSVTFDEPLQLVDFLLNLYQFQGELLIANIEIEYAKAPFYTAEIAKEEVASSVLQTVVTNKIKQWDQSEAHNSANGTPVFVKADKNGEEVTGVYFSKTTPWVGDESEQFSEFRVMINGEAKTGPQVTGFSFSYKIDGTVEKNDRYTFTDLKGEKFSADAYVQIKTAENHPLAGDNYPELSGTDLVLDGEWHEMTIAFDEPLQLTNILFNLYHFQGELIIADLVVNYAE